MKYEIQSLVLCIIIRIYIIKFAMYFYIFGQKYGIDFVVQTNISDKGIKGWSLVSLDGKLSLCLGPDVAWSERYLGITTFAKIQNISKILSSKAMKQIHRMVNERYTTYKAVVPLYITNKFVDYYKLRKSKKNKDISSPTLSWSENSFFVNYTKQNIWQSLILVPDFRTASNIIDLASIRLDETVVRDSTKTDRQKIISKNDIQTGKRNLVISTHSGIFCDWADLRYVYVVDSRRQFYNSSRDPRYKTIQVIEQLRHYYKNVEIYYV